MGTTKQTDKTNGVAASEAPYMVDDIFTVERLAACLSLSERYIRDNINAQALRAYKRGNRWYILRADLVEWIKGGQ